MFAMRYLPSLFLPSRLPWHSIVWSKNTTFLAAKAVKSLCMFFCSLYPSFFFSFWFISPSCVDFVFLLPKFKHLKNRSVGYAFSSFYFFFLTYAVLFPSMTKQHRQERASGLPACAMIQQVVKGRNVFFFGKGWERKGRHV